MMITEKNYSIFKSDFPGNTPFAATEHHIYGSSRLGMYNPKSIDDSPQSAIDNRLWSNSYAVGNRTYEFSDHLGNVHLVLNDKKETQSATEYYPFGMPMQSYSASGYRYGFNGKELDKEGLGGGGSTLDYGFRIYNAQLGKFLSVDPLSRSYPWNSTYGYAENDVIRCIDLDGLEKVALSGWVPENQYYKEDSNGDNLDGRTHYNATHIKFFKAQATRLKTKYGFDAYQVGTGQDIVRRLEETTTAHGYISFVGVFGHGGVAGDAGGLFLKNNAGLYTDNVNHSNREKGYATVSDIQNAVSNGTIKFSTSALAFFDACNMAGNTGSTVTVDDGNFAYQFVLATGVASVAATGHVEMKNQKSANGQFKISDNDNGHFFLLKREIETYTEKIRDPNKSPLQFWKGKIEVEKTRYIVTQQDLGTEVDIDDYVE